MNQIIVSISDFEERAALLEGEKLTEFFIQRNEQNRINGNIYKARVANVLPGMESAFLDIGTQKNAFLHVRDLREFEEKYLNGVENSNRPIEDILSVGDEIIVQIVKEPRGDKGARVTTHYTIPGKYLVLMPNDSHIAISQKIKEPKERERLETTIDKIKPDEMGVIIRTAAKELRVSIITVKKAWEELERQGFIYTVVGRGCFVANLSNDSIKRMRNKLLMEKLSGDIEYYKKLGISLSEIIELIRHNF